MQPIETLYKGCRFRSRLEARWAVLLDQLGVSWAYEFEGFNLDGVWYLPDFWIRGTHQLPYPYGLPQELGFWLEIKPTEPDDTTLEKCRLLSLKSGHCVYLAAGNIGLGEFRIWKWISGNLLKKAEPSCWSLYEDGPHYWDSLNMALINEASTEDGAPMPMNMGLMDKKVIRGYGAARSARF